jgi:hypothetical protein
MLWQYRGIHVNNHIGETMLKNFFVGSNKKKNYNILRKLGILVTIYLHIKYYRLK